MSDRVATPAQPDLPSLELMSLSMILDKAIHLYVRNFGLLVAITAIPSALEFLLSKTLDRSFAATSPIGVVVLLAYFFLIMFLSGIGGGAMTVAISNRYLGRQAKFGEAYSRTLRKCGVILLANLVAGVFVILGLLAIVPGIILMLSYSLISPAVILENLGASKSRRRSRLLMKGFRWQAFLLFLIYFLIYFLLIFALRFLFFFFQGLDFRHFLSASSLPYEIVNEGMAIVIAPIPSILCLLIYYNQRIRKENFDLVVLAEAMAGR
jgi:hypothetical protein